MSPLLLFNSDPFSAFSHLNALLVT